MKILFITSEFPPGPGGIGNHAWNLSRELNNYIPVHVLTVSDYAEENECVQFDNKEKMYLYRFKRYNLSFLTYLKRVFDIVLHLAKNRYSHCILSGRFSLYTSNFICLISGSIKLIGVLHGSELIPATRLSRLLLKRSLKNLNIFISVSQYTDKLIPLNSIDKSKRYIIPNGVNVENFDKSKNSFAIILSGKPCLISVGSITDRKGQVNLVTSLPLIIKKYPQVHYHCIGLPIKNEELLKVAKKLKVDRHLTLHGFLPNDQLFDIYKQSDILIMLSQNKASSDVEGFGIVVLEANLCGVSAIGSKDTGIEDAIVQNKTGKLVNPYSPEEVLDAINQILNNKEKFSLNAIEWSHQHTWKIIVNKYLQIIENA